MIKKILLYSLATFLVALISFYFWASSSSIDEANYHTITEFSELEPFSQKDTFSIVTYNIGYLSGMINNLPIERTKSLFENNYNIAKELIADLNPDIIAFQEIDYDADRSFNRDQYESLGKDLNYAFGAKSINWDMNYVPFPYFPFSMNFGYTVSGQAMLSRYPIVKTTAFKFEKPKSNPFYYNQFYIDRLLQIMEVDLGKKVTVINVHLEAYKRDEREKQMDVFIDEVKDYFDGRPLIILGDFNSKLNAGKDRTLKMFLEAFPIVEASVDSGGNYTDTRGTYPADAPSRKIDHIFYTPESIQFIDWDIPIKDIEASDHLPVIMTFKLK